MSDVLTRKQTASMLEEVRQFEKGAGPLAEGRDVRTIRGSGWTEKEALDNAMRDDEAEYGHGEGYGGGYGSMDRILRKKMERAPKKPTKVTVKREKVAAGKPKRTFTIKPLWRDERGGFAYDPEVKRIGTTFAKQADALKAAKKLALLKGTELIVELVFEPPGNTVVARLEPQKGQMGIWSFEVSFRS